jgi:glc operon protein GlcG
VITKIVLGVVEAAAITAACLREAQKNGWAMSVAVVDDVGRPIGVVRFDGAGYRPLESRSARPRRQR